MSPEEKLLALLPELTDEEKDRRTREGLPDVDAGRTIPHEELLRWVRQVTAILEGSRWHRRAETGASECVANGARARARGQLGALNNAAAEKITSGRGSVMAWALGRRPSPVIAKLLTALPNKQDRSQPTMTLFGSRNGRRATFHIGP